MAPQTLSIRSASFSSSSLLSASTSCWVRTLLYFTTTRILGSIPNYITLLSQSAPLECLGSFQLLQHYKVDSQNLGDFLGPSFVRVVAGLFEVPAEVGLEVGQVQLHIQLSASSQEISLYQLELAGQQLVGGMLIAPPIEHLLCKMVVFQGIASAKYEHFGELPRHLSVELELLAESGGSRVDQLDVGCNLQIREVGRLDLVESDSLQLL